MPITYVRMVHSKPTSFTFRSPIEHDTPNNILLFDPVLEATSTGVPDLYRLVDSGLTANDIVIFRGAGADFVSRLREDRVLHTLLRPGQGVALASGASEASPGPNWYPISDDGSLPPDLPALPFVCHFEVQVLLYRNRAVFASEEYHYALPSGWHADRFVRLGDGLRNIYDVHRIADWLLTFVSKRTIVLGDTGSMLPLLQSLREQARSRLNWEVAIATLDEYPRSKFSVQEAVEAANKRPAVTAALAEGIEPTWLFVISVNSSGRLCGWLREHLPANGKIVVVCETSTEHTPCDIALSSLKVERTEAAKCKLCQQGSRAIHVDTQSYELVPKIEYKGVRVDKEVATKNAEFWSIANEAEAVELHKTIAYPGGAQGGSRHFSVLLLMERLARHGHFRQKCREELDKVKGVDLVLIPDHPTRGIVEELCREVHPHAEYRSIPHGPLSDAFNDSLKRAQTILVADDALVTGATLKYLRSDIFRLTKMLGHNPDVCAFVMVSRPSNKADHQAVRNRYTNDKGVRFFYPYYVLLPDGQSCSWCAEERFLGRFRSSLQGDSLNQLNDRIEHLERRFEPPLLMVKPAQEKGDLRSLGSFFGLNLAAKAAFAAGSCAAQTVIQDLATLGGGILFKVADLGMAYDAYYESVILASLLRTFHAIHVRCPSHDELVEQKIKDINPGRAYPGVLTELALAALMEKIPSGQVKAALESWRGQDSWIPMLIDLFKLVEPK
jgi:hypothetical protein